MSESKTNLFKFRVIYADTDQMGVAYHGNFLKWFEMGRTELLRQFGISYKDTENLGVFLPVTGANVTYLSPAFYDDILTVETYFTIRSKVRLRFDYTIYRENDKIASGYTEHVITDRFLKPARPPDVLNNVFQMASSMFRLKETGESQ